MPLLDHVRWTHRLGISLAISLSLAAMSCATGPSAEDFGPATSAHGVETHLRVGAGDVQGELLELRDSAFVLLSGEGVLLVPLSSVRSANFSQVGSYSGGSLSTELATRLHLVSRFPRGIPDSALQILLADRRQAALLVIKD